MCIEPTTESGAGPETRCPTIEPHFIASPYAKRDGSRHSGASLNAYLPRAGYHPTRKGDVKVSFSYR